MIIKLGKVSEETYGHEFVPFESAEPNGTQDTP